MKKAIYLFGVLLLATIVIFSCSPDKAEGPTLATLTTIGVTNIGSATALSGGNISSDGGYDITARGVVWSTSPGPTIANSKTIDGIGTGNFSSSITALAGNQTYYVRAYATNNYGIAYGNEITFTTLP